MSVKILAKIRSDVRGVGEVAPEQAFARENSDVMRNIAEATDVSNFSPIRKNIFNSMLP